MRSGEPQMNFFRGYLNFNHFALTKDALDSDTTKDLLLRLFWKHSALQLFSNQPYWDILIPVYCGTTTETLKKENFSAILIQIKNRETETTVALKQEYTGFFHDGEGVLFIHMELGLDASRSKETPTRHHRQYLGVKSPYVAAITVRGLSEAAYLLWETNVSVQS
jgi:hypothetical protein